MARKPTKKPRSRATPKARKPKPKPSPKYKVIGPYSPEQRAAIVERMKGRHSPTAIKGKVKRPDFHVTTDIRATSDPLWQHLATFRRRLMEGGSYTPAQWQGLLLDIRMEAHDAGLRPHLGTVEWIAATLGEAREGDPSGAWDSEPDGWSKVILTAFGEAGWIQLHDLLDGFADTGIPSDAHKRPSAVEWAESWMNARERQLCQSAAVDAGEYRPATWFPKGMAARLRMAAQKTRKTKRVAKRTIDRVVCYRVADARRWWPADVPDESKQA